MVTFATWQFPHTFWNGSATRLVMNNTLVTWEKKTIWSNEKVNEDEHKHTEMWKNVDQSINK
jgi:uncharacterized membrane protein